MCTFKTSPCAPAPRAHVEKHVDVVPVHTGTFWNVHTGACRNPHTGFFHGFFSVSHTKHTTTTNNTTTTTTHTTQHTTSHGDRQRETEKEGRERRGDERGETRQNNRRQKKTGQHEREDRRQKINFQCGGAWPFLVDGVLCLVHPVNHRVFSLLHRFKYDCSLILSASWPVNSFF